MGLNTCIGHVPIVNAIFIIGSISVVIVWKMLAPIAAALYNDITLAH